MQKRNVFFPAEARESGKSGRLAVCYEREERWREVGRCTSKVLKDRMTARKHRHATLPLGANGGKVGAGAEGVVLSRHLVIMATAVTDIRHSCGQVCVTTVAKYASQLWPRRSGRRKR